MLERRGRINVWLYVIFFVIGLLYGYFHRGRENKIRLLKKGLMIGVVIGIIVAGLGVLFGFGLVVGATLFISWLFLVAVITISFVLGTYIGDWLETRFRRVAS